MTRKTLMWLTINRKKWWCLSGGAKHIIIFCCGCQFNSAGWADVCILQGSNSMSSSLSSLFYTAHYPRQGRALSGQFLHFKELHCIFYIYIHFVLLVVFRAVKYFIRLKTIVIYFILSINILFITFYLCVKFISFFCKIRQSAWW